ADARVLPQPGWLPGLHARTAARLRQEAGGRERLIAQHLGREPHARPARQETVLRITLALRGARLRGLAEGRREHDPSQERLQVPAAAHEVDRQRVEQLLVRRQLALRAEVLLRG